MPNTVFPRSWIERKLLNVRDLLSDTWTESVIGPMGIDGGKNNNTAFRYPLIQLSKTYLKKKKKLNNFLKSSVYVCADLD